MNNELKISPELWQAYEETDFIVFSDPQFTLRIGKFSEPLEQLLRSKRRTTAAFLTAFNPYSQPLTKEENTAKQDQLIKDVELRGLHFLLGIGQHPSQQWEGEPSLLILGIGLEAAKNLGNKYEQNAFVWADSTCKPRLLTPR
jgi:hypothetical protein